MCSFISPKVSFLYFLYFSYTMTGKGKMSVSQISSTKTNCQIASGWVILFLFMLLFNVLRSKVLEWCCVFSLRSVQVIFIWGDAGVKNIFPGYDHILGNLEHHLKVLEILWSEKVISTITELFPSKAQTDRNLLKSILLPIYKWIILGSYDAFMPFRNLPVAPHSN